MNYFFIPASRPNYPLVFAKENPVNGSFLALGRFITDNITVPLKYNDANNSDIDFEKLLSYDVLDTVGGGLLVSGKVYDVITAAFPNEVQFFKASFVYKNQPCDSYYVMNIYNNVECYDMEKSIYTRHPVDQSYNFAKVVLKNGPIEEYGYEYNAVREAFDNKMVVSKAFVDCIKQAGINSMKFTSK